MHMDQTFIVGMIGVGGPVPLRYFKKSCCISTVGPVFCTGFAFMIAVRTSASLRESAAILAQTGQLVVICIISMYY